MNTIRRRLTLHLLILWGVLLSIGGGIAYSVTRTALTRHFDEVPCQSDRVSGTN